MYIEPRTINNTYSLTIQCYIRGITKDLVYRLLNKVPDFSALYKLAGWIQVSIVQLKLCDMCIGTIGFLKITLWLLLVINVSFLDYTVYVHVCAAVSVVIGRGRVPDGYLTLPTLQHQTHSQLRTGTV